jgi:hypothetical protein
MSAVIQPSAALLRMAWGVCVLGCSCAAWGLAQLSWPLWLRLALLLVCVTSLAWGLRRFLRSRGAVQVDIADSGELVLRLPASVSDAPASGVAHPVQLAPASTLWPHALLLHLRNGSGDLFFVPVLWDSVQPATFKALAIAFRWIAVHHHSSRLPGQISAFDNKSVKF